MKLHAHAGLALVLASAASASMAHLIRTSAETGAKSFTDIGQAHVVAVLSHSSQTGEQIRAAVDAYVESQRREQHVPGLAPGVLRDDQLIKAQQHVCEKETRSYYYHWPICCELPVSADGVFQ